MLPREEMIGYDSNVHFFSEPPCSLNLIQPLLLPWRMKKKIDDELGGHDIKLVMEKKLTGSDLTFDGLRIPRAEILEEARDFLQPRELSKVFTKPSRGLCVSLLAPNLKEFDITLKMGIVNRRSNYTILTLAWNDWRLIDGENLLKVDEFVQLWSFRGHNEQLRFALVNLSRPEASWLSSISDEDL